MGVNRPSMLLSSHRSAEVGQRGRNGRCCSSSGWRVGRCEIASWGHRLEGGSPASPEVLQDPGCLARGRALPFLASRHPRRPGGIRSLSDRREDVVDACYNLLPRRIRCLRHGPLVPDPLLISHPLMYMHHLRVHVVGSVARVSSAVDTRARQPADALLHFAGQGRDVECIPG